MAHSLTRLRPEPTGPSLSAGGPARPESVLVAKQDSGAKGGGPPRTHRPWEGLLGAVMGKRGRARNQHVTAHPPEHEVLRRVGRHGAEGHLKRPGRSC